MFTQESKGKQVCDAITAGNADLALSMISDMKAQDLVYITQDQESLITLAAHNKMAAVALAVAAKMDTRAKHFLLNLPTHDTNLTPIQKAIRRSDDYAVRVLLALGADLKSIGVDDMLECDVKLVPFILDQGEKRLFGEMETKLMLAAFAHNNTETGFLMIERGCDPLHQDTSGNSILHHAVRNGNISAVSRILEVAPSLVSATNHYGETPMYFCILMQNLLRLSLTVCDVLDGGHEEFVAKHRKIIYTGSALHGTEEQYIAIITKLIESGADIRKIAAAGTTVELSTGIISNDFGGYSLLHYAASKGFSEMINFILTQAPELLDLSGKNVSIPIVYAAENGHKGAVQTLIAHGAKLSESNSGNHTALHSAVESLDAEMVGIILAAAPELLNIEVDGRTPIMLAAYVGAKEILSLLMASGASLTHRDSSMNTAAHLAAIRGCEEFVRSALNDAPELVDAQNSAGATPLDLIAEYKKNKAARIRRETEERQQYFSEVFQIDDSQETLDILSNLLDVNAFDDLGYTHLHYAVQSGSIQWVNFLISRGADVDISDSQGETALHHATRKGDLACVISLLQNGARVCANRAGITLLHLAAESGNIVLIELFLSQGIDIETKVCPGTPLHHAANAVKATSIKFLLAKGAIADSRNSANQTPLQTLMMGSSSHNQPSFPIDSAKCAEALAEYGADITVRDSNGFIPLHHFYALGTIWSLIPHDTSFIERDSDGLSILVRAIRWGRGPIASLIDAEIACGTPIETLMTHFKDSKCILSRSTAEHLLAFHPHKEHANFNLSIVSSPPVRSAIEECIKSDRIAKVIWPKELHATVVLFSDSYLRFKSNETSNLHRFFTIVSKLPLKFQEDIINLTYGSNDKFDSSSTENALVRVLTLFELRHLRSNTLQI